MGLQERRNINDNTLELHLSCTKQSIWESFSLLLSSCFQALKCRSCIYIVLYHLQSVISVWHQYFHNNISNQYYIETTQKTDDQLPLIIPWSNVILMISDMIRSNCCCHSTYAFNPSTVSTQYTIKYNYRQTSNISRTSAGNKLGHHSHVVGASPVGSVPTISSFSTEHLASMDWEKTTARQDENHISFVIWCYLILGILRYQCQYGINIFITISAIITIVGIPILVIGWDRCPVRLPSKITVWIGK